MKITNKDLVQPYILTSAKYDFSVYEKRILYRIIEVLQSRTNGLKLRYDYSYQEDLFGNTEFIMPIACFLKDSGDKNHTHAKKALISLRNKGFEYEDSEKWGYYGIIEMPEIIKGSSSVKFKVTPLLMKAFLNFSKGYRKYELKTAMEFESVYAMRFYELLSTENDDRPITYKISNLKIMFGIEDKYKLNADFIRKIIKTAKKELDAKSPVTFNFETKREQGAGRAKNLITFYKVFQPKFRDPDLERKKLQKKTSLRHDLDKITINYLKESYLFSEKEIMNNIETFKGACENPNFDMLQFLADNRKKSSEKKNPKGWIIGAIKKQLEQVGDYDVQSLLENTFKKS